MDERQFQIYLQETVLAQREIAQVIAVGLLEMNKLLDQKWETKSESSRLEIAVAMVPIVLKNYADIVDNDGLLTKTALRLADALIAKAKEEQ